jgi:hypothetical protein
MNRTGLAPFSGKKHVQAGMPKLLRKENIYAPGPC